MSDSIPRRILILSASAGAGHTTAARALEAAVRQENPGCEVLHEDALKFTNKVFRKLYADAYLELVNSAPVALGWLYDHLDKPWKRDRLKNALTKLNTRPLVKLLHTFAPDLVICTHFLPAEVISFLKDADRAPFPFATVVTDFDVHAMWLCRHTRRYFVAIEESKVHLEALGVPGEDIRVLGIPIDPVFAKDASKLELRLKHGLNSDVTTLLVSAGGFGVGSVPLLVQSLLTMKHTVQIIIICGKNEQLFQELNAFKTQGPIPGNIALKVIGFTREMHELMSAADLFIGKPGGLTTSEALAKQLPMVIVNPIPGQEERNSDHLLEEGIAIKCNNFPTIGYKVDLLLGDRPRMARMSNAAERIGRPQSAVQIARSLLIDPLTRD